MKVAILIHGHLYAWKHTKDSFLSVFRKYNPDIFVDTYYESYYTGETQTYTKQEIKGMFSDLNLKALQIDQTEELVDRLEPEAKKFWIDAPHGTYLRWKHIYAQMYKICRSNKLRQQYEQQHNIKYDLVVKARPDILYQMHPTTNELQELLNCGKISMSDTHTTCDLLAIGRPSVIDIYCSCLEMLPKIYSLFAPGGVRMTIHMILHYTLALRYVPRGPSIHVLRVRPNQILT